MSSTERGSVVVAVLVAALSVWIAPASAGKAQTINVLEVDTAQTGIAGYAPPAAPAVGQGLISHADLYRWAGSHRGARIGSLKAYCVFMAVDVSIAKFDAFCVALLSLPVGTIEVLGSRRLDATTSPCRSWPDRAGTRVRMAPCTSMASGGLRARSQSPSRRSKRRGRELAARR